MGVRKLCCCENKCNKCYLAIIISLVFILLMWNVTLTVIVLNDDYAHINSFNYVPENLQDGGYITFDTNRVVEKNDITHQEGSSDFIINYDKNKINIKDR